MSHPLRILLAASFLSLAGCAHAWIERTSPGEAAIAEAAAFDRSTACVPHFPYADGWYGGDAAYSVPLPERDETSLWLFGDSFVGRPDQTDRLGTKMPHNTIAFSRCDEEAGWQIEYFWEKETARAFFRRKDEDGSGRYWWLFDGFVHAGKLYVGLLVVEDDKDDEAKPFDLTGMELARVANYRDHSDRWEVEVLTLSERSSILPGAAMVVWEDHVYFFTFSDPAGQRPLVLSRLSLTRLESGSGDLSADLEFLAPDESWRTGLDPDHAAAVISDGPSEMSVHHDDGLDKWVAIYNLPSLRPDAAEKRASSRVFIRTADRLEGPWSERGVLFLIPELHPDYAGGSAPDVFCYAAKAHSQFSSPDRLLLTYVCNRSGGKDPWALWRDLSVYRPQVVSIPLPYRLRLEHTGDDER